MSALRKTRRDVRVTESVSGLPFDDMRGENLAALAVVARPAGVLEQEGERAAPLKRRQ